MKPIFTLLLLCIGISFNFCEAQTKRVVLSELTTGFGLHSTTYNYSMAVNLETNDTSYYVSIFFRDHKYTNLSYAPSSSVLLDDFETVEQFKKDLKQAIPEIGKKVNISWDRESYTLRRFDNTPMLCIYDEQDLMHTTINKRSAKKLLSWLNSFDFKGL